MAYTFCADFGSTFTKLCVFDLENGELVMTTKHPTTVGTDASIALLQNFEDAKRFVGEKGVKTARILSSSSAAGGLRMVVIGLTRRFSLLAGKNVALGAGARIIKTYENKLCEEDVREIEAINPEIILLCGGIEGGNTERLLHNTAMLKTAEISSYVVYAGNRDAASYIRQELMRSSISCYLSENVFPEYGKLNSGPAGEVIRDLFMKRIAGAKGLQAAFPIIGEVLMPTPAAVLSAGELLAEGTEREAGLSGLMIFDVGGATTDVYSYADASSESGKHVGAPEPYAKRTVEGDLGVRSSCLSLMESVDGKAAAAELDMTEEELTNSCRLRAECGTFVPDSGKQARLDGFLAKKAVELGARRHCGRITNAYAKNVCEEIEGKDLTKVSHILGTGGPVIHSPRPAEILQQAVRRKNEKTLLLPEEAEFYADKSYILYAVGLCREVNPDSALHILKESIIQVND